MYTHIYTYIHTYIYISMLKVKSLFAQISIPHLRDKYIYSFLYIFLEIGLCYRNIHRTSAYGGCKLGSLDKPSHSEELQKLQILKIFCKGYRESYQNGEESYQNGWRATKMVRAYATKI